MTNHNQTRGSIWRQWDLHIHTPESFHWCGEKFNGNKEHDDDLIDQMIHAMNDAEPAVFAIMDYWTFDGWFKLQNRLEDPNAPKLNKVVFPGIELRLAAPMTRRLNAHVIFSNNIKAQDLDDFKSKLRIALMNDKPLSNQALIELAQKTNNDMLEKHGFTKEKVNSCDKTAFIAGCKIAEITMESYEAAIFNVPNNQAIGFMPFETNDGLAEIDWVEHYAYVMGLFQSSPIFETRKDELCSAFIGERTSGNARFFDNFQAALQNIPRLAVSGSDAHCFKGVAGNNDKRGYGDFPSNKKTWIKADTSFEGLKQAIIEPAKRSYIGEVPPKLKEIESNKTFYIDSIKIKKTGQKSNVGHWLHDIDIFLNPDLIAIIGNKGSGKSALADIIAMLGNSKQSNYFSFLKKNRFLGKSGEPANQFEGTLTWHDNSTEIRMLHEFPEEELAERVRYVPQGYFEELCNKHVSGESDIFENELRSVIFSHIQEDTRGGALNFEQLIERQEQSLRNKLSEYRNNLSKVNTDIVSIEGQLQPIEIEKLRNQLQLKNKEIEEHEKIKPSEIQKPEITLDKNQQKIADNLSSVNQRLQELQNHLQSISAENTKLAHQQRSISDIQERLLSIKRLFEQAEVQSKDDLELLDLSWSDIAILNIKLEILKEKEKKISSEKSRCKDENENIANEIIQLTEQQKQYTSQLAAPQQKYEAYQLQLAEWEKRQNILIGSPTEPNTKIGLETRIEQINQLPEELNKLREKRLQLSEEIFDILDQQRKMRISLFKPVQDLIQQNDLIREDYRLQFQATLSASPDILVNKLFALIKQTSGEFRGQDEASSVIKILFDEHNLNDKQGSMDFINKLFTKIEQVSKAGNENIFGISNILRKDQSAKDVYDLIFGLEFLEPKYSLSFQDTQIEQLSPGQRGSLLLIFYLLVDKGQMPIILDQPEENLDNETVFRLLVPVLSEAKKKRQIIMVTHNPNLAVVCDAEQIIYAHFDRSNNFKITYKSGAIENTSINEKVVTILEGTKPAFNNRSGKYHS